MTSQLTTQVERFMSTLPSAISPGTLDLLDGSQALSVDILTFQLVERAKAKNLHGVVQFEDWFHELDAAQRLQIIDFINTKLEEYRWKLEWFAHAGLSYGYRFAEL